MSKEEYKCTLDENSLKKAKEELLEDEKERMSAVESLRNWIKEQPHFKTPEEHDTLFLLRFLRSNHFSQLESRKMLTKYITAVNEIPVWFANNDTSDPKTIGLWNLGYIMLMPRRDSEGRRIILERSGILDPQKNNFNDLIRCGLAVMESNLWDEQTQVNGMVYLVDGTGYSIKHEGMISISDLKKAFSLFQGRLAGRFKAFHIYNMGPIMEAIMKVSKPFLPKKLQERIIVHRTLESVYKHIPMECLPEDYLPDEYTGPNAGTIKDCIEYTKKEVSQHREKILLYSSKALFIDKSKAPSEAPNESFRKLNVE